MSKFFVSLLLELKLNLMQLGMEDGDEMLAMLQLICLDFSAIVSGISFFLGYRLINVSSIIY